MGFSNPPGFICPSVDNCYIFDSWSQSKEADEIPIFDKSSIIFKKEEYFCSALEYCKNKVSGFDRFTKCSNLETLNNQLKILKALENKQNP